MEHEIERQEIANPVSWQNVALAFASILFALVGWMELTFWNRLTRVEAIIAERGERIATLEQQNRQDRGDIGKLNEILDRMSGAVSDMRTDHRQFQMQLERLKR